MIGNYAFCAIENAISSPPVAVAGLAHTARVDQIEGRRCHGKVAARLQFWHLFDVSYGFSIEREATLSMGVSEEVYRPGKELLHPSNIAFLNQIEIFIDRTAVHQPNCAVGDRSPLHSDKKFLVLFRQYGGCPGK